MTARVLLHPRLMAGVQRRALAVYLGERWVGHERLQVYSRDGRWGELVLLGSGKDEYVRLDGSAFVQKIERAA